MASKVAIVTGASSGIGLGIAHNLLARGYSVVATARNMGRATSLEPSERLVRLDGDVGDAATATRAVDAAISKFQRLDLLVNNAGIFAAKPFTDYTKEETEALLSTNLMGFIHMSRAALGPMVSARAGHIVNIGTSLVEQPIGGVPASLPILIKGGIEAATRALAIEYAPRGIRVNTVAAGAIDTPLHPKDSHEFLKNLSPAHRIGTVQEIVDAVVYLESAAFVSGEILHVDGGAHAGKW